MAKRRIQVYMDELELELLDYIRALDLEARNLKETELIRHIIYQYFKILRDNSTLDLQREVQIISNMVASLCEQQNVKSIPEENNDCYNQAEIRIDSRNSIREDEVDEIIRGYIEQTSTNVVDEITRKDLYRKFKRVENK